MIAIISITVAYLIGLGYALQGRNSSSYDEEGIEELQNAGFFEEDFEEELVVEFGDDYDAVDVSPELSDFISNLAY